MTWHITPEFEKCESTWFTRLNFLRWDEHLFCLSCGARVGGRRTVAES